MFLKVFRLSWCIGSNDLKAHFSKFGPVKRTRVAYDYDTGFNKGIGFVFFEDHFDARDLHNTTHAINGKKCEALLGNLAEANER